MPYRNHKRKDDEAGFEETPRFETGSTTSTLTEKTKEAASYVGEKFEQAAGAIGAGMESTGGMIRKHEPAEGVLHNAGETIAASLEAGGRYLQTWGLKGIGEDVTYVIRRNPIAALVVGVGIGVLLARMFRR